MTRQLARSKPLPSGSLARLGSLQSANARTVRRCLVALAGVVLFGTIGFRLIERSWGLWQSLYFTLITITTVGYGDEGLSPGGEKFASIVLLVGIVTTTYCMSALVQITVSQQLAWKLKMQKQINQLSDHIIVCGFGRMGKTVCRQLADEGLSFVVVEQNELGYEDALDNNYLVIQGNATEDDVLQKAGVCRARGVVCVVNSDAENVFITLCARNFNENAFIACRADTEGAVEKVQRAGASLVVSPHYAAGIDVATAIVRPHLAEFLRTGCHTEGGFELNEVTIRDGSTLVGQTIAQFGQREETIVFVAIAHQDGKTTVRPRGSMQFQAGDVVIVVGHQEPLARMHQAALIAT